MRITQKMLKETGAGLDDIDNISSLPRKIQGVWAALTFRENEDKSIKVSARSGDEIDSARLCSEVCGGGGHKRAAGATVYSDMDTAEKMFLDYLKENL